MKNQRRYRSGSVWAYSLVLTAAALLMVQGCSLPSRLPAVPHGLQYSARIPELDGIRYWPDKNPQEFGKEGFAALMREKAYLASTGHTGALPAAEFLAISGGGDDGAFGAGLLVGWTTSGNRPEFKVVTGISTGALIAPFAFLGAPYDHILQSVYTNVSKDDIFKPRNILMALFNDAMADTTPLWNLLSRHIDVHFLQAVATEYGKGRLLLIGTTNLDVQRAVIWNMGKIAASGHPRSLELFKAIMIASASIPGVFPPVFVHVEAEGQKYHEMHVDGGAMRQVFLYPSSFKLGQTLRQRGVTRDRSLYLIRNGRLDPSWMNVKRRTIPIAERSLSALIQMQGVGDLDRIYMMAVRDGIDYNLAFIPPAFQAPKKEEFDTHYMRALFNFAYELSSKGYPWQKSPPDFPTSQVP